MTARHLFQTSERFITKKNWQQFYVCNRQYYSAAMKEFLHNPDRMMPRVMLKIDHKTTLSICEIDNKRFVIKRYNIKNFLYGLKRAFSRSRASHCWYNSHQLLAHDIKTPQPIALIENRFGPLRREAFYIYEYLPGTLASEIFPQRHYVISSAMEKNADLIVELIKKMLANKFSHGDLKDENFIFHEGGVYFIDLDAMRLHRFAFSHRKAKLKDINRFLLNWEHSPEIKQLFSKRFADEIYQRP